MIIENTELLRLWLTIQLRKLCDADPSALSKYVIALIRKDKPDAELRQGMIDQLDVFLQHQTIPFVDRLFLCLSGREYMEIQDPNDGTVYMLNQGKKLVQYHELPNPFDSTISSISSHEVQEREELEEQREENREGENREEREESDLNTSTSTYDSVRDSSVDRDRDTATESDVLNTSIDTADSNGSVILAADPTFRLITKGTRTTSNGSSARKDKMDRDRLGRRKSRSPRRNRSRDRIRRSWSPKEYHPRSVRSRGGVKRSPGRKSDRDPYSRRRNSRNRSSSPYSRSRSPRYSSTQRERSSGSSNLYEPKRIRSPIKRDRSPLRMCRLDGMETKNTSTVAATTADQTGRIDNAVAPKLEEYSSNGNRCKDFDERGLCMRGELCPYDHGNNPVVLQDVGVTAIKRSVHVETDGEHTTLSYRPDPPDFGLLRPNRPIMNSLDDDMHNAGPMVWGGMPPFHPGPGARMRGGMMMRPPMFPIPSRELINIPVHGPPPMMEEEMPFPPMHHMGLMFPQQQRHALRGRGRGRGGMFDHSRLGGKAKVYTNCSLEVKRIPAAQNTISDLNTHFVHFGKIVNIQINFEDDPEAALITFSSPSEAYAAYKSTEAVLNNRFIRVFWHNKEKENEGTEESGSLVPRVPAKSRLGVPDAMDEGKDGESERVLLSGGVNVSKPLYTAQGQKRDIAQEKVQAVEAIKKSQEQLAAQEQQKRANEEKKRETLKLMHDLQKKKQVMLSEQIEQQKKLIKKLETNRGMKPDEKEELMKLIKTLQESIETIKKGMDTTHHPLRNKTHVPPFPHHPPTPTLPLHPKEPVRDILDAELDLYHTELEGGDTVALQQKVAELRSHAYSSITPPYGRGGRGRGVGGNRGKVMRGGSVSRTVDRRPTTIVITGFPPSILPELMAHFAQYGVVPYHQPNYSGPSLTMTYESRKSAEAAFSKGRVYKDHVLDIKWVSNPQDPPKDTPNGSPPSRQDSESRDGMDMDV